MKTPFWAGGRVSWALDFFGAAKPSAECTPRAESRRAGQ